MASLKVIIADDHGITRLGLHMLCREALPFAEITEVESLNGIYKEIRTIKPDLLMLDLLMNDTNCLTVIPELLEIQPSLHILVITMADEKTFGNRVLLAGAKGYVNKLNDNEVLKTAIQRVSQGMHFVSQEMYLNHLSSMGHKDETVNPFAKLTDKELEIVHYLITGLSTSEIGEKARLALSTVSTYKNRIFTKLNIDNLVSLINLSKTFNTNSHSGSE